MRDYYLIANKASVSKRGLGEPVESLWQRYSDVRDMAGQMWYEMLSARDQEMYFERDQVLPR